MYLRLYRLLFLVLFYVFCAVVWPILRCIYIFTAPGHIRFLPMDDIAGFFEDSGKIP